MEIGTYTSADVLCPYYEKDIPKTCSLICEGILPGSRHKSYFPDRAGIQRQMGKYCANDYERCPWYIMLTAAYARRENP